MKPAITKTKKILAVLMCIFMLSSFAVPFVGAEGEATIIPDPVNITVPTETEETKTEYVEAVKIDGATYSICVDTAGTVLKNSAITCEENEPKVTVKNSLKDFVLSNGGETGECTVYLRAFSENETKYVAINLKNYKVTASFYADGADEPLADPVKVLYGTSVKDAADKAAEKIEVTFNKYYHHAFSAWTVSSGNSDSTVEKVLSDTVFTATTASALHDYTVEVETIPATCTKEGSKTLKCSGCDSTITEVLPVVPHTFDKENEEYPYVNTSATCTAAGIESGYCTTCGEVVKIEKSPLGHNMVITKVMKVATCEEAGYTNAEECTRCDYKIDSKKIEALGHTEVNVPAVEPTCTEDGHSAYVVCGVCGKNLTEPEVLHSKGGHDMSVDVEAKAATCTEPGNTAGKKCANCDYTEGVEVISALEHIIVIDKEGKAATCTEAGWTQAEHCEREGCDYAAESTEIPANGHTEEVIPAVAATCTDAALTEGKKCSVCGAILVEQENDGEPLGHDWVVDESAVPATCTEHGKTEAKHCKRCGEKVEPEETALLPHEFEIVEGKEDKAATCTEDGLSAERKCKNCDAKLEEEVIPALGHVDEDNNNICDRCGAEIVHIDPSENCDCICHSDNTIVKFLWSKILVPIIKFLGVERYCKCGVEHWSK